MKSSMTCCCRKSDDVKQDGDENTIRGNWSGKADFFLASFGFSVGLGNMWRFPYLCYKNGGGAFLIPYVLFLLMLGWPLFFLEAAYGQFSSLSPVLAWRISPLFKGVGCGMVVMIALGSMYYNVIIAWTLFYVGNSFSAELPWATCNNTWNTDACVVRNVNNTWLFDTSQNLTNATWNYLSDSRTGGERISTVNDTNGSFPFPVKWTSPSEEFWDRHVLQRTSGIHSMGEMRWELFACYTLTWVVTCLCIIRGVKSSGKAVYVTALAPVVIQIVMLCRGVTLPGAIEGIKLYIIPKWETLLNTRVWIEAAFQIAYSSGAGWGGIVTMASYNKFHTDCYKQAVAISSLGSAFSIFSGFVVFSIIGYLAHEVGEDAENVVSHGPGLIFVVYPAALAKMPGGQFWSVLFFLMVFMVGLDSQFAGVETVITTIVDNNPRLLRGRLRRMLLTALTCFVIAILGIPCVMQGGVYVLSLLDWYIATLSVALIFFTELVVISWIYGLNQFFKDIELMIGYQPHFIWKIMWGGVSPALTMGIFLLSVIRYTPVSYGSYVYPQWAVAIGWTFALLSFVPIPLFMVKVLISAKGNVKRRLKDAVQPTPEWGPALPAYRELYIATLSGSRKRRILPYINCTKESEETGTSLVWNTAKL
ncbi:sodium- and chloride-dependent glycine transporter 1-like isoform X1 [Lineus longissimus]|uniref:sodium- and chloride-dependent glycine transporter 1-like isoform X1 n=2 Tax=Lineus longissimus TaxID=88925 RepID=UPI00315CF0FB